MKRAVCALLVVLIVFSSVPAYASVGGDEDDSSIIDFILSGLQGLFDFLLSGIKGLFLPSAGFMEQWQIDISERFSTKFGGVTSALGYLSDRFGQLREYRNAPGLFEVVFPSDSFLHGVRMNVLSSGREVLYWIRFCVTGVAVLATAMSCYHKVGRILRA